MTSRVHADALRVKDVMIEDANGQVVQLRQALSSEQGRAQRAESTMATADQHTEELRAAQDGLAVQEGAIRRLEEALEDMGEAKDKADMNEVAAYMPHLPNMAGGGAHAPLA